GKYREQRQKINSLLVRVIFPVDQVDDDRRKNDQQHRHRDPIDRRGLGIARLKIKRLGEIEQESHHLSHPWPRHPTDVLPDVRSFTRSMPDGPDPRNETREQYATHRRHAAPLYPLEYP